MGILKRKQMCAKCGKQPANIPDSWCKQCIKAAGYGRP